MATLQELLNQRAELERRIAETQRQERADAISKIRQLMSEHGLTVADLSARTGSGKAASSEAKKVAAKYRNPATGESWTGRGLKPKWLQAALAEGKSLADFAI